MKRLFGKSLYRQLILILLILALVPLLGLSIFGYSTFNNILFEMIAKSTFQTVDQMGDYSENVYQDMNDILTKVSIHPRIQRVLKEEPKDDWQAYLDARFFSEYTNLLMVGHPEVKKITIYNLSGKRLDSVGRFLPAGEHHIGLQEIKDKLQNNLIAISSIYAEQKDDEFITFGKMIIDLTNGEEIGFALVDLDLNYIGDVLKNTKLLKSGYIFLLNESNKIIYHPSGKIGEKITREQLPLDISKTFELKKNQDGERILYIPRNVTDTGWKLVGVVPYEDVIEKLMPIRYQFFLFFFIVVVSIIVVAISIYKLFVRPIHKLHRSMSEVENGNFEARVNFKRDDEIGKLGFHFNNMVQKIEDLIEKVYQVELKESRTLLLQKQAEIEALQEKITPHFLYNTLNTISWFAHRKGVREIQVVVDSLSNMLRYSLKSESKFVTLEDEFNYLKLYADIIDFRYEGEIKFRYELPEETADALVPRLSIQPIVENAIKHAFQDDREGKQIKVSAMRKKDDIVVIVEDNGCGITEEQLFGIYKRLKNSEQPPLNQLSKGDGNDGLGLVNVHQRFKLTYGEEFGIKLKSKYGEGTTVKIKFHIIKARGVVYETDRGYQ
jgi:two-component system sensor histidine kinase YesM